MRGVRGVGLRLVDPRRVGVDRGLDVVGGAEDAVRAGLVLGAGQHHERLAGRHLVAGVRDAVGTERDQRVVGLEGDEDGAAALDGLVEAVVEELAEEGEQRVVRRRVALVGADVGDRQRLVGGHAAGREPTTGGTRAGRVDGARHVARRAGLGAHREARRRHGRRVGRGLVDDQVADHPRLRVEDVALLLRVRRGRASRAARPEEAGRHALRAAEGRRGQPQERLVGASRTSRGRGRGCCRSRRRCAGRRG